MLGNKSKVVIPKMLGEEIVLDCRVVRFVFYGGDPWKGIKTFFNSTILDLFAKIFYSRSL